MPFGGAVAAPKGGIAVVRAKPRSGAYLTLDPPMTGPDLPALELAVAKTLGFSFFGFLASLLPRFFSLDMVWLLMTVSGRHRAGRMPWVSRLPGPMGRRAMIPVGQRGSHPASWDLGSGGGCGKGGVGNGRRRCQIRHEPENRRVSSTSATG